MTDTHQAIDDITPSSKRNGAVILSSFAWAAHRYTMAFLLGLVVVCCGVGAHDYLQYRSTVDTIINDRNSRWYEHEQRLTQLEDKSADHMSAYNAIRSDNIATREAIYQIRGDIQVLKSRSQP